MKVVKAETAFCMLNCNLKYSSNSLLLCVHIKRRLHALLLWAVCDTQAEITEVSISGEVNEHVDERTRLLAHAKCSKKSKEVEDGGIAQTKRLLR